MDKSTRFMEAVAAKVGAKRKPMMKRKGLTGGPAVLIAIGAPKKPMMGDKMEDKMEDKMDEDMKMSKADKIAALQEKIAGLKAELALPASKPSWRSWKTRTRWKTSPRWRRTSRSTRTRTRTRTDGEVPGLATR